MRKKKKATMAPTKKHKLTRIHTAVHISLQIKEKTVSS